jgi:hypothetical protein
MKRPKNYLIALPKVKSPVMVHGITKSPFKAVAISHNTIVTMRVCRLIDGEEFDVDFAVCTHTSV